MTGKKAVEGAMQRLEHRPPNDLPDQAFQHQEGMHDWNDWVDAWDNWHDGPIFENWLDAAAPVRTKQE